MRSCIHRQGSAPCLRHWQSDEVIRNRPEELVEILSSIETFARSLGPVEIVMRERYALLRSTRIFADLVMVSDAVRAVIHLRRRVAHPLFFKVGVSD